MEKNKKSIEEMRKRVEDSLMRELERNEERERETIEKYWSEILRLTVM